MNSCLITNNDSFKSFLLDEEDDTIRTMGWEFSSWSVMFMTLLYHDENLAIYLEFEFEDFSVQQSYNGQSTSLNVARFLYAMDKEDLRNLYYEFIDKDEVISDLMILNRKERIELIADRLDWKTDDVCRLDLILAN